MILQPVAAEVLSGWWVHGLCSGFKPGLDLAAGPRALCLFQVHGYILPPGIRKNLNLARVFVLIGPRMVCAFPLLRIQSLWQFFPSQKEVRECLLYVLEETVAPLLQMNWPLLQSEFGISETDMGCMWEILTIYVPSPFSCLSCFYLVIHLHKLLVFLYPRNTMV